MSIDAKHAYRFEYLKSEKWGTVRLEALVREKGKCQICSLESIHHDAHHMWYPENIWDTTSSQLVILCRSCHDFVHEMVPECKTNDEEIGRHHWNRFKNAIVVWRLAHLDLFDSSSSIPIQAKELRTAYEKLRKVCRTQAELIVEYQNKFGVNDPVPGSKPEHIEVDKMECLKGQRADVLKQIEKWYSAYCEKELLTVKV